MYTILVLSSVQMIIWSIYALVTYLSHQDPSIFEYILLIVFCYFGYLFGVYLRSPKFYSCLSSVLGAVSFLLFRYFLIVL
ncbi:hypothetical protein [Alkalihalobacillus sp. TS-13]|uniref:hypothetical protein n=1 Tax=Alkalihalobacillus sp. TS-13 TaxID=2842455 RepID=UPI001C86E43D|nr:hypothetical protein [Alkalihalobacillus sp. TS-13]